MTDLPIFVKDPTAVTQEEWFEIFIHKVIGTIRHRIAHLGQSEPEDVPDITEEIGDWFNSLIEGPYKHATPASQERFQKAFAQTIIVLDYLSRVRSQKLNLLRLAIHPASDKICVWAEINDDDIKTEYDLIGIEAKINAVYLERSNMILETMIVEKGDNLAIPNHYKRLL